MSDQFVAEIRIFPFNFAPVGWAFCNGQLLPISQNTALFSLLGTNYGGDGRSTFGLPNLQGTAAMNPDQGPGLTDHFIGETGGSTTITLLSSEMPAHSHNINCVDGGRIAGQIGQTSGVILAKSSGSPPNAYVSSGTQNQQLAQSALSVVGGSQPHNNLMPYLTLNFCIAMQGIFPPRS
jgi:microcystin-dependent protein